MVSSQVSSVVKNSAPKLVLTPLLLPLSPPDSGMTEHVEFDFSDVFGSPPMQPSIEASLASSENAVLALETEHVYDDPVVVYNRSHSLVGPTSRVSQILQLSKLTIPESDSSSDIAGSDSGEPQLEFEEHSTPDHTEKPLDVGVDSKGEGVGLDDFEILKLVGQGAFGKVYQVKMKGTSEILAMKVMRKDKIMEKNHAEYMKAERDILTKIDHPFVVQLRYSFQTKYRLYLVLDFINGGHLFFQLFHQGLFREDVARIYAAEIVSAVSHLHTNGVMHRDLKPENILLDADGHVMLTDFGLAKEFEENARSNSLCGTVEYMAPEILLGKGHDKAADWWSVGVLVFEMLTGKPPFIGGNRDKIQQKIIKDKIKLPGYLSSEAHSLLKGLLNKDASKRLGCGSGGSNEIRNHKWFKSINWRKLEAREVQPGFRPVVAGKHCIANFEERWTKMPVLDSPVSSPVGDGCNFKGFSYVRPSPLRP